MRKIIAIASMLFIGCAEKVEVSGVIIEHKVVSDRSGNPYFYTIVKKDDGEIKLIENIKTYTIPVGTRVKWEEYK